MTDTAAYSPAQNGESGRGATLLLVSASVLMGMSVWFTASAVAPELQARWDLTSGQVAWLTGLVQLGFVLGTALAAVLNLADIVPSRTYFATSAVLAATANAALLFVPGVRSAFLARLMTGFFLAGVYPPAMKMIATWFRTGRGIAIGTVVGALTVGKATPYLLKILDGTTLSSVVLGASGGALAAAVLVGAFYRDGPFPFPRSPFSWSLVLRVVRDRPTRLATGGYLGHMWELYAMWTWVPAFLAASAAATAAAGGNAPASWLVDLTAFGAIAVGGLGCVWGGWYADRTGRARVVNRAMAVSGACSLSAGVFFGGPFWLLVLFVLIWGFFVVADSAQFSAMVTEVAPPEAVGTALTLQTSLGFLLTIVTIQTIPLVQEAFGWHLAFPILALGPIAGIAAIHRMARDG